MDNEKADTEKFEELCTGYVLQALDTDERNLFEEMLHEASKEEQLFYQEMKSAASQMAFAVEGNKPSDQVKEQLMAQVRSPKNLELRESTVSVDKEEAETLEGDSAFNWSAFTGAASFALLIICLSLIFYALNLNSEINNKEAVIEQQQEQLTELEDELLLKEELLTILAAREVDMVLLSGMEANPDGFGKIIWNSETREALLQVGNLPVVPEGKEYQLWMIINNKPVSAGIFSVKEEDDQFFRIEDMTMTEEVSEANTFAVTIEPEGGMPRPTGETYLMGSMEEE